MINKGWLTINIASVLDIIIVLGTIVLSFMVLTGYVPITESSKEVVFYVFGALMAIVTSVYNYHRGSSQGSKDKTDIMEKMNDEFFHVSKKETVTLENSNENYSETETDEDIIMNENIKNDVKKDDIIKKF